MILYSEKKEIHSYLLFGIWQEFHDEVGCFLLDHEARTATGEKIFMDWMKTKWEVDFILDDKDLITELTLAKTITY